VRFAEAEEVWRLQRNAINPERQGVPYADLGDAYLDKLSGARTSRHLVRRLEALGYRVHIELIGPAS
jgi:hypothetical protein